MGQHAPALRAFRTLTSVGEAESGSNSGCGPEGKLIPHEPAGGWRLPFFVLALVTVIVGFPLLFGRVLAGQDIVNYLIHAQQTAANLRQGHVFPSWGGGYNAGYGSPVLLFFPPLTSTVDALAVLAGIPVIFGVEIFALAAHLASGLAVFFWLRSTGWSRAALPAAIVYMTAPYRFIDLYFRSALAEHWAFIWPPLILWVASSPKLRPFERTALTSLTVAGLLLTNVPLAVLFGIGLAAWFVISKTIRGCRRPITAGVVLGFGIAAFSLVPAALASHLLNLKGCFGSASGKFQPSANMLFSDGLGVWNHNTMFSLALVLTFVLSLVAWALLSRDARKEPGAQWVLVAAVICVVVTLGPLGPLWDVTPILRKLQFPWRITAVLTLLGAAMTARLDTRRAWVVVGLAAVTSVPFSSWNRTMASAMFNPVEPARRNPQGTVFPNPHAAWEAGSGGWYWRHQNMVELCLLPKSMHRYMMGEFAGSPHQDFSKIRDRPAALVEDPAVPVRVLKWGQTQRTIEIDSATGGTLMWRVLWFPRMLVRVDGQEVLSWTDAATGLVENLLPPGHHVVEWNWRPFPALRWAQRATVVALLTTVVLLAFAVTGRWRLR
jgi:hypothetical protein